MILYRKAQSGLVLQLAKAATKAFGKAAKRVKKFHTPGTKYPKGPLSFSESEILKSKLEMNAPGLPRNLRKILGGDRSANYYTIRRDMVNHVLYGGYDTSPASKVYEKGIYGSAAGLAGTALAYTGGFFLDDPYKNKLNRMFNRYLYPTAITQNPNITHSDTLINLNDNYIDYARINENGSGQVVLGGEFIEADNNSVRSAEEWRNPDGETYSDKDLYIQDINSFYGVEDGVFKVGGTNDFKDATLIVPNRFGSAPIGSTELNEGRLRFLDNSGNVIYNNMSSNYGKAIIYSPKTKKSIFIAGDGESNKTKVDNFIVENGDGQLITLDMGRYAAYMSNKEGLTEDDYKDYYSFDKYRVGTPGYNVIINNPK